MSLTSRKIMLAFVCCLLIAFEAAAQTPTPTGTGVRRVNRGLLRGLVRGLQLDATTDVNPFACWEPSFAVTGWTVAGIILDGGTTSPGNGSSLSRNDQTLMRLTDAYLPTICSTQSFSSTSVTSPTGATSPAYTWTYDPFDGISPPHYNLFGEVYFGASLPIRAYTQPGLWTLQATADVTYTITIDVPSPSVPFGLIDWTNGGYLLGGLSPGEAVVGMKVSGDGSLADAFEAQADNRGYAFGEMEAYIPGSAIYVVPEDSQGFAYPFQVTLYPNSTSGITSSVPNSDDGAQPDEMIDFIRSSYFSGSGASGAGSCGTSFVARLSVGDQGRRADDDVNVNIRPTTSTSGSRIGLINNADPFDVLDGPQCAGGLTWWNIRWNGITGWIAEAANGAYLVEPTSGGAGSGAGSVRTCRFEFTDFIDVGDSDGYAINVAPGDVLTVLMVSEDFDTFVSVYNDANTLTDVVFDDDSGGNLNSLISNFVVGETATYIVNAGSYNLSSGGNYTLTIELTTAQRQTLGSC
jgi:hypothetical protein